MPKKKVQASNPEITEELGRGYAYQTDREVAGDLIRRYGPGPITAGLMHQYKLDKNGRPV